MEDRISFKCISTHNLKNIDIDIIKNKITAIYGRSGGGKTSLAFSTIYQVCHDEFESIENGYYDGSDYGINFYSGVIPAIAVSQNNKNNNPRSTLYSSLNIPNILSNLKYKDDIPDFNVLKINKIDNQCDFCDGLGDVKVIEDKYLINENLKIRDNPFLCWKYGDLSGFYQSLLMSYCNENNIDIDKKYIELTDSEKDLILYGKSDNKLAFKFKYKSKTKQRRSFYYGVMDFVEKNQNLKISDEYFSNKICPHCHGSRIKKDKHNLNILGVRFVDFMTLPIDELVTKLNVSNDNNLLIRMLKSIINMGVGYLSFSRSIPTLSGGELQKLKFSRLLNSEISGVLIVIDEISSQLNEVDFSKILDGIKYLSKRNTIILVEHCDFFIRNADYKIHIGPRAGNRGGYVCNDEQILPYYQIEKRNIITDYINYTDLSKNNVIKQSVSIPVKCLTAFIGVSGSGKSSLAKSICDNDDSIYISQKISSYNNRSVLASSLGLSQVVAKYFSEQLNEDIDLFLLNKNGGCKVCNGTGMIKYERGYDKDLYIPCHQCGGLLFDLTNPDILKKVNGYSIVDFYNSEINEIIDFCCGNKVKKIFNTMNFLGLSHLKLNRKTQTLSGGEKRRLKLCELLSRKTVSNKILIIDEPSAGLDSETACNVIKFIHSKVVNFKATIIIEHREEIIKYADYIVEVGPNSGFYGGRVVEQKINR